MKQDYWTKEDGCAVFLCGKCKGSGQINGKDCSRCDGLGIGDMTLVMGVEEESK